MKIYTKTGDKGQTSLTNVKLDNQVIIETQQGNVNKTPLGKNNELNGKKLKITTTISDTSRETNLTFVTIKVSGGFLPRTYPLFKLVDNEGDSADYYCVIEFFNP